MRSLVNPGCDCIRAWESMPWVLQGTATPLQNDWLHSHLAHCEACRAEFEQQSRLRLAMSLLPDVPVDASAGLARLLHRIDASDPQKRPVRPRAGWLVRTMAAAVLVQAIGIGALGTALWTKHAGAPYRTFSQQSAPVVPGSIRVVPDASMTLANWDELLRSLQLRVVDGPNSVGAYTVAPMDASTATQRALRQLRATRGISLAEPVDGRP